MCGIAILLIKLKGSGHAKYLEWSLDAPCSCSDTNLRKLDSIVQSMQDDLNQWNFLVEEMRFKYHALNYFTNKQLLLLRYHLGEMKSHPTLATLSYDVKMLLASVSHPVEETKIMPILYEIATDFEKSHKTSEDNKHIIKSQEDISDANASSASYEDTASIDTDKMNEEEKAVIVWLREMSFSDSIILEAMKKCGLEDDNKLYEVCVVLKTDKEKATVNTVLDQVEIKKIDEPQRVKISEDVIKQSKMPELYTRFDPLLAYAAESLFPDDFDAAFLKCVRENESIAGDGKCRSKSVVELQRYLN